MTDGVDVKKKLPTARPALMMPRDIRLEVSTNAIPAALLSDSRINGQIYANVDPLPGQELIGSVGKRWYGM